MRKNHKIERKETEEYYRDYSPQDKILSKKPRYTSFLSAETFFKTNNSVSGEDENKTADTILFQGLWYNAGGTLEDLE